MQTFLSSELNHENNLKIINYNQTLIVISFLRQI